MRLAIGSSPPIVAQAVNATLEQTPKTIDLAVIFLCISMAAVDGFRF
jgi:hypothetical protein